MENPVRTGYLDSIWGGGGRGGRGGGGLCRGKSPKCQAIKESEVSFRYTATRSAASHAQH